MGSLFPFIRAQRTLRGREQPEQPLHACYVTKLSQGQQLDLPALTSWQGVISLAAAEEA